ncbi:MAG TPA: hypothetical protein VNO70_15280 [Blastocatellia bacterium]|nr:hypothetical protein [Blastocatellia bacterium]
MRERKFTPKVGVMGAANADLTAGERERLAELALRLGAGIAQRGCVLVTGATTGLPEMVARAARKHGGLTIGISPAANAQEHVAQYCLPLDATEIIIYTGFGLKGRNVVNIRSSDIVIIFGGGMGTLNEFTIAYDEGKVIGMLEGTGGVADHMREIVAWSNKPTRSLLFYEPEPELLLDKCLDALTVSDREA